MKTRTLSLLGLFLLLLAAPEGAQRGSKGSGGSHSSPSAGSHSSASRPSSQGGSRGSSGSSAPRPSSGGSSRPSAGSSSGSSRGSYGGSSTRPSAPPAVRPSAPPAARPSQSPSSIRPSAPSYPSSRPTGVPASPAAPAPSTSGSDIYAGRQVPSAPDSAPTAGPSTSVGAPAWSTGGGGVPSAPAQPRVRFPTPYSPAGSTGRGSSVSPSAAVPSVSSSRYPGLTSGKGSVGKPDSGPSVSYDRGPTKRIELPRPATVVPTPASPSMGKGDMGKGDSAKGGKGAQPAPEPGSTRSAKATSVRGARKDPETDKKIQVTAQVASRAHHVAVGAAVGSIGGVLPGDFHGGLDLDHDWVCDPWGWNGWSSCNWGWGWSWCGWSSCWAYPFYWSWYFPCWWWYSRPYYAVETVYYPATTVVYAEPEVVYVNGAPPAESVGEGVASYGAGAVPAAPEPSPLAIAAQRYLELGDRAFREGRYFDAVQFYAKAVEFAPDQGALYLVLADALFAAGDYHYGAYAVRRALELDPALVDSRVDKHSFYPDPRLFDEQLAALEGYLKANPSDRDARLVLALNYLLGARPKDAVRVIEETPGALADDAAARRVLERARQAQ